MRTYDSCNRSPALVVAATLVLAGLLSACSEQTFSSNNSPPEATLVYPPPDGASAFEDAPVVFRGQIADPGSASEDLEFAFISDRDGELGRGAAGVEGAAELEAVTLSVGEHRITLQATDPQGASGSASATLEIVPNSSPVVGVTTVEGAAFLEGEPIVLEGTIGDPDHDLSSLTMSATSETVTVGVEPVINGDGSAGEWFLVLNEVPLGEHAVVLEALDPLGKGGGAVATFRVNACTDADGDGFSDCAGDCNDGDASIAPGRPEACNDLDDDCDGSLGPAEIDDDADGVTECGGDCNDGDSSISPDATESCDGLDGDCDGAVPTDELDLDADGISGCAGDCGPLNPLVFPGASEICNGLDDSCDGNLPADETDADSDGVMICQGDCDDADATVSPIALESCDGLDNDCDGLMPSAEADPDADGVAACAGDCVPTDSTSFPGAPELCDGQDNDCDGVVPSVELDLDADGVSECGGDCAPLAASVFPGAPEICDGLDNNCDGAPGSDELDSDSDGWTPCNGDCDDGTPTVFPGATEICDGANTDCSGGIPPNELDLDLDGWMVCNGDCDEAAPATYPGAPEACDAVDNDCDGAVPATEIDGDGDAFSDCQGDCDDTDAAVFPFTAEVCDGVDTDCDGTVPPSELDVDGDGWMICEGDCDDVVAAAYPGAPEQCNGVDDDCNTSLPGNENDSDADGWMPCAGDCDDSDATANLDDADSDGFSTCTGDCDDAAAGTFPTAPDPACDGLDTDCVYDTLEVDDDGDGYRECEGDCDDSSADVGPDDLDGDGYAGCAGDCDDTNALVGPDDLDGDGYSGCTGDCDDTDPTVRPSSFDVCWDGIDTDCSGDGYLESDDDGDGAAECEGDCDDADPTLNIDDLDGDGWSNCMGDCDEASATAYPGATEGWDALGEDADCDGNASEVDMATAWTSWTGGVVGSRDLSGHDVASGDFDGDGLGDLLIGAPDQGAGMAFVLLGASMAGGGTTLAAADVQMTGEATCDHAGFAVAVGDFDGDGLDDAVVAAKERYCGLRAGKIHIVLGTTLASGGNLSLASADIVLIGENYDDASAGLSTAVGDFDGDGLDDLLVGVPGNDDGGSQAGKVSMFLGTTLTAGSSLSLAGADAHFLGAQAGENAGLAVASAGDVDGDGLDDVLIGGPDGAGRAYLLFGATIAVGGTFTETAADAIFEGQANGDNAGRSVSSAGDVDGDGLADILIGGGAAQRVYLMFGSTIGLGGTWLLSFADVTLSGAGGEDARVASAGDVDGDGLDDILIGSTRWDRALPNANCSGDTGAPTSLVLGTNLLSSGNLDLSSADARFFTEVGNNPGGGYGYGLASAGDVDGDGLDDILLGLPCWGTITGALESAGKSYLFLSPY